MVAEDSWYFGKYVAMGFRKIVDVVSNLVNFAYEQHTLLQFIPDDMKDEFDPYFEIEG